ncbi:ABC transporter substrate-binding protein [Verminephrobacter aporrectodeae]|uniref:ABC transporter substrate-binding protein n=1 Tax=Verminephrobacter aporrectodeae TaxID=1110389 RepID=UPI00023772D1|nr:ABC transporter substrate-binding protein [Verminephrobacter aporrectodeae]
MQVLKYAVPRTVLGAALAGAMLFGAAAAAHAQELRIGVRAGPEAMDPHYMAIGNQIAAIKNVYEALVSQDEQLRIQPALATAWKLLDDTTWEFKLRPQVKFHDGSELHARDVKFSLERVPRVAGPNGGLVINTRNITEVLVLDSLTVRIRTSIPNPSLPQDLARIMIVPAHIGDDAQVAAFNSGKAAIGTGPFKLLSFKPRTELLLERFDSYWRGPADWKRVQLLEISNDAARLAALASRRVDLINFVPYGDVAKLKKNSDYTVLHGDSIYIFLLYPDFRAQSDLITDKAGKPLASNPLRDKRVREALSLAVDRRTIAATVLEGLAKPANQIIVDKFFGAIEKPAPAQTNLQKARELLAQAGYPDGFALPLHCTSDRLPGDAALCSALGQMLAKVGLDVKVNAVSRTVFIPARARGEYVLSLAGWGSLTGEAGYTLAALAHTNDKSKGFGAFNFTNYSNPGTDAAISVAMRAMDSDRRRLLLSGAMQAVQEDYAIIPLVQLSSVWATRAKTLAFTPRVDDETLAYFIQAVKK